jgi:hypothetical protein
MEKYDAQLITDCVRDTFNTPAGQVTLDWLRTLYVNVRHQHIVQSNSPNLAAVLSYGTAQKDVVVYLEQVMDGALLQQPTQQPTQEDEEYE